MRNAIVIALSYVLMLSSNAQAHPPSVIEIEYVKSESRLYVYMDHLSRDHRKHYIRKTSISINEQEVATESNRQQVDPNVYAFSVDLQAKEGDLIEVKAYSSEGGVGTATFIVPEKKEGGEPPSAVKAKVEEYQTKDRAGDVYGSKEEVFDDKSEVYKK